MDHFMSHIIFILGEKHCSIRKSLIEPCIRYPFTCLVIVILVIMHFMEGQNLMSGISEIACQGSPLPLIDNNIEYSLQFFTVALTLEVRTN